MDETIVVTGSPFDEYLKEFDLVEETHKEFVDERIYSMHRTATANQLKIQYQPHIDLIYSRINHGNVRGRKSRREGMRLGLLSSSSLTYFAIPSFLLLGALSLLTRPSFSSASLRISFALLSATLGVFTISLSIIPDYNKTRSFHLLSSLLDSIDAFKGSVSKSIRFLQEVETISRGYRLSRNLSASCLLDESAHVRLCSRLRFTIASCLDNVIIKITACSMDLKRLIQLANIDHHGLAENPSCRPPSGESNEGDPSQSKGEVISICQLKDLFSLTNQKLLSEILDQLVIFYIASINHCTEAISFHNQSVKELSGVFNSASLAIDNALGSLQVSNSIALQQDASLPNTNLENRVMLNCLSDFDQMLDTVKVKLLHITTAVSSSSSPQPHATSMTATSDIVTSIDNDLQCALLQYQKLLLLYGSEKTSKEIQHQDGAVPQPAPALNDEDPEIQTSPQLQQLDLDSLALENTRKGQKEEVFECEEEVADNDTKVDKSNQTLTRSERISARKAQMERDRTIQIERLSSLQLVSELKNVLSVKLQSRASA